MRTSSRRRRRAALAIVMIVAGVGGLVLGTAPARADVDTAQALGFGASIGGTLNLLPPTPVSSLSANEATPPADLGPIENITTDINLPGVLRVPVLRSVVQAGNLAGEDHSGFAAALAEVTNPSVGLDAITADALAVSCISNGDGSTSDVTVSNLNLGPQNILNGPIAPNTEIIIPGVATVILHEQIIVEGAGATSVIARAAHIQLLPSPILPTAVLDIILGEVRCAVQGPDVLATTTTTTGPTTSTTTGPTTSTTTGPTTSTTTGPTTSTTTGPTTSTTTRPTTSTTMGPTTSTTTGPTTSTTTGPTTSTTRPGTTSSTSTTVCTCPTTSSTTLPPPITIDDDGDDGDNGDNGDNGDDKIKKGFLSRTGSDVQPLAVLSGLSVVLGILLLVGTGRPLRANVSGGTATAGDYYGGTGVAHPEKWGPAEIVKTIGGALAALVVSVGHRFGRRRRD